MRKNDYQLIIVTQSILKYENQDIIITSKSFDIFTIFQSTKLHYKFHVTEG